MSQVPIEATRDRARAEEVPTGRAAPKSKTLVGAMHRVLRSATRGDHASIDRLLLPFDLRRNEDYRNFLNVHAAALTTLQDDWRLEDREDFAHMLDCAHADLETLGAPPASTPLRSPKSGNASAGLGIAYVVRGSRLGAKFLRRGVGPDLPTSYLDFVPSVPWAAFLLELESIAADPQYRDEAVRAARSTFNVFATEIRRLRRPVPTPTAG